MVPPVYSTAGLSFTVLDGFARAWPPDPPLRARELCEENGTHGVVLLAPPRAHGEGRLVVYDGSGHRLQLCGHALRCAAQHLWSTGMARQDRIVLESDSGHREIRGHRVDGEIASVDVDMGMPEVREARKLVDTGDELVEVTLVDSGERTGVVFVSELDRAAALDVAPRLAATSALESTSLFVFAACVDGAMQVLPWCPRFELPSSSAAACAAAVASIQLGLGISPVRVASNGGELVVAARPFRTVWVEGAVRAGVGPDADWIPSTERESQEATP